MFTIGLKFIACQSGRVDKIAGFLPFYPEVGEQVHTQEMQKGPGWPGTLTGSVSFPPNPVERAP